MSENAGSSSQSDLVANGDGSIGSDRNAIQKIEGLFELLRSESAQVATDGLPVGSQLADFEIIRPLAEGGMGRVYLARQLSLDRLVALKVSSRDLAINLAAKERFVNEGKVLAKFKNPYVVPVIAQGEANGILFLVMEYVEGVTLADLLNAISTAGKDRSASDVVGEVIHSQIKLGENLVWNLIPANIDRQYQMWVTGILSKVADGLASVHREGIVHRDFKPANIVLEVSGEPRIVDFGLARVSCESTVTQTGQFLGTPAYASPEQLCNDSQELTPASDVYSFGVLLFECLCLRRPFETTTLSKEAIAKHTQNPPLLRTQVTATPWELEAIADKCLNADPQSRYETADALAADLHNFLALRPITAKKATAHRRLARAIRAKPWAFTASLLGIFLIALIATGAISATRSAAEQQRVLREEEYGRLVAEADASLCRLLVAERPTWMKETLEKIRTKAIDQYSNAIALFPERVWPVMQRGRLYASKQETINLAIVDFRHVIELRPELLGAKLYLTHFDETDGIESDDSVSSEHAELVTNPTDLYWLATFYGVFQKDLERSSTLYFRCISQDPENYWARIEHVLYSALPDVPPQLATEYRIQQLRIARSIRPELPFAGELLAIYLEGDGKFSQARDELDKLNEKYGLNVLRAHKLSQFAHEEGRIVEARQFLLKAKEQDSEGTTAWYLGDLEQDLGNYQKAVEWYELAREESSEICAWNLKRCADAYTALGRLPDAEDAYQIAIRHLNQMSPNELKKERNIVGVYSSFAKFLEQHGREDEAEEVFRTLLELEVEDSDRFSEYAKFLIRRDQPSDAIRILQFGIETLTDRLRSSGAMDSLVKELLRGDQHEIQGFLCKLYVATGDSKAAADLFTLMKNDLPYTPAQVQHLVGLCQYVGANEEAMTIARMGEYTETLKVKPELISSVTRLLMKENEDGEISHEFLDRILVRRSLGMELDQFDYCFLARHKPLTEAVAILKEAVERNPHSYQILACLAAIEKRKGSFAESKSALEVAINRYEHEAQFLSGLAEEDFKLGDYDLNLRLFRAVNCTQFFADCMEAADEDSAEEVTQRIRRAQESIGGDPSILTEPDTAETSQIQQILDLYELQEK